MKNIVALLLSMLALHLNAQQKIDRLYCSTSLLFAGQYSNGLDISINYDFGLSCNFNEKHVISAGYSFWKINEKEIGGFMFGPTYIKSCHSSIHLLYGRYVHVSPKTVLQCQLGPSYYISEKLDNFHLEQDISSGGLFLYSGKDWKYDKKIIRGCGILIRADCVVNFRKYGGLLVGIDMHFSSKSEKLNLRIGLPFGYFQQIKKRIE